MRILELGHRLSGIKFIREVSTLQIGQTMSLLAGFVGTLVFPNILGNTEYGIYAIVISLIGILSAFVNFGLDATTTTLLSEAVGRGDRAEIRNLIIYYLKISLLVSNIFWLLLFLVARPFLTAIYGAASYAVYFRIMVAVNILSGPWPLLRAIYQVFRKINTLTVLETAKKYLYILLGLLFVVSGRGVIGIFYSLFLTEMIYAVYSCLMLVRLWRQLPLLPRISDIIQNFRRVKIRSYLKFGSLIAVDKNLNTIVETTPGLMMGIFSTPQQAAIFKIAYTIGALPRLFSGSISRMLGSILPYKEAVAAGSIRPYYHRVAKYGFVFTILMMLAVAAGTMLFFRLIYKPEFWPAQKIVYLVLLFNLLMGYAVSFGPIVRTLKKMISSIYLNVLALAIAWLIGYLTIPHYGAWGGALSMAGWFIASIILIWKIEKWLVTEKQRL